MDRCMRPGPLGLAEGAFKQCLMKELLEYSRGPQPISGMHAQCMHGQGCLTLGSNSHIGW